MEMVMTMLMYGSVIRWSSSSQAVRFPDFDESIRCTQLVTCVSHLPGARSVEEAFARPKEMGVYTSTQECHASKYASCIRS